MNRIQLAQLRDVAIEYLPEAQQYREQAKLLPVDEDRDAKPYAEGLWRIADKIIARNEATAEVLAAAQLLLGVTGWECYDPSSPRLRDADPAPEDMRDAILPGIANAVKTLANVTGRDIPMIDPVAYFDTPTMPADAPTAKGEAAPATSASGNVDHDETLTELFDPVPVEALEKMFPANGKWRAWAEKAKANGLINARVRTAMFNPYKAGVWFVNKGAEGWDTARLYRKLKDNLPARSRDAEYLLTNGID